MTKRRKPRKQDEKVTYSLEQTQRYVSEWSRYNQGLRIAAEHVVHDVDNQGLIYRIPSDRSSVGYWQVERVEEEGEIDIVWEGKDSDAIDITWEGKKPDTGEIDITWEGKDFIGGEIEITWEGKQCKPQPFPYWTPENPPDEETSGCGNWEMLMAFPQKLSEIGGDYEICPLDEILSILRSVYGATGSDIDILRSNGGSGFTGNFDYGVLLYDVGFPRFCGDGSNPQNDCIPAYRCVVLIAQVGRAFIPSGVVPPPCPSVLDAANSINPGWVILEVYPPTETALGCDLLDYINPSLPSPGGCIRGVDPIAWNCIYPLTFAELNLTWSKLDANSIISNEGNIKVLSPCPPPQAIGDPNIVAIVETRPAFDVVSWDCTYALEEGEFSLVWSITADDQITNDNGISKTLAPCPPPQTGLTNIKISAIADVRQFIGENVSWDCTYIFEEGEFSLVWAITGDDQITNDNAITKTLVPCTPPYPSLENILIIAIGEVHEGTGEIVLWNCTYTLEPEEFSLVWTITGDNQITNDNAIVKTLTPCTPPSETLDEIRIHAIADVNATQSGYKCTCPDFSKQEEAFSPPPFPSMSQQRAWTASAAGCPTWSDGRRRCKHVVAVQQIRGEAIPIPSDFPLGEA